jgi:hypothetical protein
MSFYDLREDAQHDLTPPSTTRRKRHKCSLEAESDGGAPSLKFLAAQEM